MIRIISSTNRANRTHVGESESLLLIKDNSCFYLLKFYDSDLHLGLEMCLNFESGCLNIWESCLILVRYLCFKKILKFRLSLNDYKLERSHFVILTIACG